MFKIIFIVIQIGFEKKKKKLLNKNVNLLVKIKKLPKKINLIYL